MRVGLVSDTHGLLRPEAIEFLRGSDYIVHGGDIDVLVIHEAGWLDLDPAAAGYGVVVSGHSHRPRAERRDEVWHVNPGSAGPRRFKLPVAVGELRVSGVNISARIVELDVGRGTS